MYFCDIIGDDTRNRLARVGCNVITLITTVAVLIAQLKHFTVKYVRKLATTFTTGKCPSHGETCGSDPVDDLP